MSVDHGYCCGLDDVRAQLAAPAVSPPLRKGFSTVGTNTVTIAAGTLFMHCATFCLAAMRWASHNIVDATQTHTRTRRQRTPRAQTRAPTDPVTIYGHR